MEVNTNYNLDRLEGLQQIDDGIIDFIPTDPPYGIEFMGKLWDKAIPPVEVWEESLRVLKPGAFMFVMSIPRSDCLSRMMISIEDAGFITAFTPIFWAFATGFPKAMNISKTVDKRNGSYIKGEPTKNARFSERDTEKGSFSHSKITREFEPQSEEAKSLDGSYAGFQPKPAVEVIIVAMKPLSEKSYVDQALANKKGMTWLGDARIPYESDKDVLVTENKNRHFDFESPARDNKIYGQDNRLRSEQGNYNASAGRFPANLIVSDDVMNDGTITKSSGGKGEASRSTKDTQLYSGYNSRDNSSIGGFGDVGSFSRYFDLDAWWESRLKKLPRGGSKDIPIFDSSKSTTEGKVVLLPCLRKGRSCFKTKRTRQPQTAL